MKCAWMTDLHLDFVDNVPSLIKDLATKAIGHSVGCVFITGDTATSKELVLYLSMMETGFNMPIYFVCGNHDYYSSSIVDVKNNLKELAVISPFVKYAQGFSYRPITHNTAIVGADGWYDAMYGDWQQSQAGLNDWNGILEFRSHRGKMSEIIKQCKVLAAESASHVAKGIKEAAHSFQNIVILTHVPPFAELAQGPRVLSMSALPWYSSAMMGSVLLSAAKALPKVTFTVLCGHTHDKAEFKPTSNMTVKVGGAVYGKPCIASEFNVL
jgi:Icc protein